MYESALHKQRYFNETWEMMKRNLKSHLLEKREFHDGLRWLEDRKLGLFQLFLSTSTAPRVSDKLQTREALGESERTSQWSVPVNLCSFDLWSQLLQFCRAFDGRRICRLD